MRLKTSLLALILAGVGIGCHQEEQPALDPTIAKNLMVAAEGSKHDLTFKVPAPGTVIVTNFSQGGTLYKGRVNTGDVFTLPMISDHALVGKQAVHLDSDTNSADTYRVYFLKD